MASKAVPFNTYISPELHRIISRLKRVNNVSLHYWLATDPRVLEYLKNTGLELPPKYKPIGRPKNPKTRSLKAIAKYQAVPISEWQKGNAHVASLLEVSVSSVCYAKRILRQLKLISI